MPTYAYRCTECHHHFDALQKITDKPLVECPNCHKNKLQRGPGGGIGLVFKGTGFYQTDYGNPPKPENKPQDPPKGSCGGSCDCH